MKGWASMRKWVVGITVILWTCAGVEGALSLYDDWGSIPREGGLFLPGQGFKFYIHSGNVEPWTAYVVFDAFNVRGDGAVGDTVAYPEAGASGGATLYYDRAIGEGYLLTSGGEGIEAGIQHELSYGAIDVSSPGAYYVSLYDAAVGFERPVDYFRVFHTLISYLPDADPDGPYVIGPGQTRTLNGRYSWTDNLESTQWRWSIAGKFVGEGDLLDVTYDILTRQLGLGVGSYDLELEVALGGKVDTEWTTIIIVPEPSSLLVFGVGLAFMRRRWGCGRRSL